MTIGTPGPKIPALAGAAAGAPDVDDEGRLAVPKETEGCSDGEGRSSAGAGGVTRKRFLWTLGLGSLAIVAHVSIPRSALASAALSTGAEPDPEPRLRPEVSVDDDGEGLLLTLPSGERPLTCAVNEPAAEVVRQLDGRTSVSAIAQGLAARQGARPAGEVEAQVACFVAQLGELGFLRAPFYALIVERYDD